MPNFLIKTSKRKEGKKEERWGYSSVVELLPGVGKAPGSIFITKKKEKTLESTYGS